MKKITTSVGVFGPYEEIQIFEDRYYCDGGDLPFSVVGQGEISDVVDGDFPIIVNKTDYKILRQKAYPSFADQFDVIFHNGLDAWKEQIQAVKDKYPKS
jgi:hypothetical protein